MLFLGLVVLGGVEGEVADDFAGLGVGDGDVEVLDQEEHGLSVVCSADADVVEAATVAEGDGSFVDFVGADSVVGPGCGFGAWAGLGACLVGRGGGASVQ